MQFQISNYDTDFLLNFDGYNRNKVLNIYLNCLQIKAYINAYNG